MMTNLFNVFDPSTSMFNFSLNWMSTYLGFMFIPSMFWMIPSRYNLLWNKSFNLLHMELKNLLMSSNNNYNNGSTLLFIGLFTIILFNNFLGLFPYIFTSSSHLIMTLSLSLPLWVSFMIYGWFMNTQHMFTHLVPQGTPIMLMNFMVCIETISNLIRPGTLAVRLMANMIAGHLLMTLLGNMGPSLMYYMIIMLIILQIMLLMLECAVTIIQSYVFTVLSTLYASEVM